MSPSRSGTDGASRLVWSLRHHWIAVAAVALLIALGTLFAVVRLLTAPDQHTATATVLGTRLAHEPASLARLAETLAADRAVLSDAISISNLPYSVRSLREDHSEVRPLEDNVLVLVDGRDADPDLAVRASNGLAEALTAELNRAGRGVGEFRVLIPATDAEPVPIRSTLLLFLLGGLVALAAGVLSTVGLLNALRRPVADARAAAEVADTPVLAVIDGKDWQADGARPAYMALAAALRSRNVGRVLVLAPQSHGHLARVLARELTGIREGTDVSLSRVPTALTAFAPAPSQEGASSVRVPAGAKAVVVVPEGVPSDHLAQATSRVPRADIVGLVFLSSAHLMRGSGRRRTPGAPVSTRAGSAPPASPQAAHPEAEQLGESLGGAQS